MPTSTRGLAEAVGAREGAASRLVARTAARVKVRLVFISFSSYPLVTYVGAASYALYKSCSRGPAEGDPWYLRLETSPRKDTFP
jgi:hypothetical protein